VRSVCGLPVSPPLALGRRRRRPKPGAEALVGLFAGDEHPPGLANQEKESDRRKKE